MKGTVIPYRFQVEHGPWLVEMMKQAVCEVIGGSFRFDELSQFWVHEANKEASQ